MLLSSFGVALFIRGTPTCRGVHSGSLGHSGDAEGSLRLLGVHRLILRAPSGRWLHSEFLSSLTGALCLSGSVEFARFIRRTPRGCLFGLVRLI